MNTLEIAKKHGAKITSKKNLNEWGMVESEEITRVSMTLTNSKPSYVRQVSRWLRRYKKQKKDLFITMITKCLAI